MEMLSNKPVGLVLLTGSVFFLVAAFLPYSRVFAENDPASRLTILNQLRTQWSIGQILFALGSLITVLGLTLLFMRYRGSVPGRMAWIGIMLLLAGMLLWSWHCIERMVSPEGFVNGTLTPYLFILYTILTLSGMILYGIFLLGTDLSGWIGWMLIVGMGVLSVLLILFKDMPPFVYYVFTLVLAIKLLAPASQTLVT